MTERSERPGEPVGSLGEEAVKLWDALSEWAEEQGVTGADPNGAAGARDTHTEPDPLLEAATHSAHGLAEALRRINEHVATDGSECRYCPLCRAIHAVRETSPEVRQHLGDAAGALLNAAAAFLADRGRADTPPDDDADGPVPS